MSVPGCEKASVTSSVAPAIDAAPRRRIDRLFWSGHSLVDRPLPDYFAAIAASLGHPVQWNMQIIPGSHLKARSRGAGDWDGYRQGRNRTGNRLDVAAELKSPSTVVGGRYDALIITEQHGLLTSLMWNDTIRYLRHFHDRAIAGNAAQTTFLYQSWLDIDDRNDPRRWIAYEREAATAWHCVATRINVSLAAAQRPDRIASIDAGAALAMLVEKAIAGDIPGLDGPPRAVIDQLFIDDVHLKPLGAYFIALFVYAEVSGMPPTNAWAPDGLDGIEAPALQAAAWTIHRALARGAENRTLDACREHVSGPFRQLYLSYLRDKQVRDVGRATAYLTWLKHSIAFARVFGRKDAGNPLVFDAAADADHRGSSG